MGVSPTPPLRVKYEKKPGITLGITLGKISDKISDKTFISI